jgi:hypothetical protein
MRVRSRYVLAGVLALLAVALAVPLSKSRRSERMRLAERIYREGVLPSGKLLRGLRPGGVEVVGAEAACVSCHRRSGMGTVEGARIVPPIAGHFLFRPRARAVNELDDQHTQGPDLAHALGRNRPRVPYTERTLKTAMIDGRDPGGTSFEELMPRYALTNEESQLLVEYLKTLSADSTPGVTADELHFATVITPGVDPARRKAMIDVLEAFFAVKNTGLRLAKMREQPYRAHGTSPRAWRLHVWELSGPPDTWETQLQAEAGRQPVFALISGLSQGVWAPVESFCEREHVPCWFPTVDLPAAASTFYSVYFSRGVLLEAELLAHHLAAQPDVRRVIAVRGDDPAAAGAAQALKRVASFPVEDRVLHALDAAALRAAVADARNVDAIVLWLRPADLARLAEVPVPAAPVYVSATLGGEEQAPLPPAWKAQARLVEPFELPDRRRPSTARFHAWLQTRGLALVDERVQADAWLASQLMSEKVAEMLGNLNRDYLVERAEDILSTRMTPALYHRLSLGPTQRFASKGGYIARFAGGDGAGLVAETDWIVP